MSYAGQVISMIPEMPEAQMEDVCTCTPEQTKPLTERQKAFQRLQALREEFSKSNLEVSDEVRAAAVEETFGKIDDETIRHGHQRFSPYEGPSSISSANTSEEKL